MYLERAARHTAAPAQGMFVVQVVTAYRESLELHGCVRDSSGILGNSFGTRDIFVHGVKDSRVAHTLNSCQLQPAGSY